MSSKINWNDKDTVKKFDTVITENGGRVNPDNIAAIAKAMGTTVNSIRSKAAASGKYDKAETSASPSKRQGKAKIETVRGIEILANLPKGSLDTFEKANKAELEKLAESLTKMSDKHNADNGIKDPQG